MSQLSLLCTSETMPAAPTMCASSRGCLCDNHQAFSDVAARATSESALVCLRCSGFRIGTRIDLSNYLPGDIEAGRHETRGFGKRAAENRSPDKGAETATRIEIVLIIRACRRTPSSGVSRTFCLFPWPFFCGAAPRAERKAHPVSVRPCMKSDRGTRDTLAKDWSCDAHMDRGFAVWSTGKKPHTGTNMATGHRSP